MKSLQSLPEISVPSEDEFRAQSFRYLPLSIAHCECPDRWHILWMGLKATGLLRGVYQQAPLMKTMLAPYWTPGGRVLIAGAADAGSLEVLSRLFEDKQASYTVVDQCKAPLEMVKQYAAQAGLDLDARLVNLTDLPHGQTWDLVFIHYTLSFLDAPMRAGFLRRLKASLSPTGVALCAVRFQDSRTSSKIGSEQAQTEKWLVSSSMQLSNIFGTEPDLIRPLLQWLPAYAQSRQNRERTMPHADVLRQEFQQAGLEILDASEPTASVTTQDLSEPTVIKNQIFVIR